MDGIDSEFGEQLTMQALEEDVKPQSKQIPTSLHSLMQGKKLNFESHVESTKELGNSQNFVELANSSVTIFDFDNYDTSPVFPDEQVQSPSNNDLVEELNQKISQLEADNVTLVEELDSITRGMQSKQDHDHDQNEVESLRMEIKSLKIDLKEAHDKVSILML